MCCVFTCCGWLIDLLQRVWTFAMSCCISSAVCCVLISASLSGIALGYNYSLAEYIDLKETNVSVYLKRGVFDDEIADDLDWRRSGHLPVAGHIKDENLITAAPEGQEEPLRSGRRLDDSLFDSGENNNKFEGQLMKLTAKRLDEPITPVSYTPDLAMQEAMSNNPDDNANRMKAIQAVLNKKRYEFTSTSPASIRRRVNDYASQEMSENPSYPFTNNIWPNINSARRMNPYGEPPVSSAWGEPINPWRSAVPEPVIGGAWKVPYLATSTRGPSFELYQEMQPQTLPTYPSPIKLDWGPIRPSTRRTPRPINTPEPGRVITIERIPEVEAAKSAEEFDKIDQKMDENDLKRSRQRVFDQMGPGDEDYDVDSKGIPSRKKRRTVQIPDVFSTESGRKIQENDINGKGFPNRYKRENFVSPSSKPSFFEKLSKCSDVYRTKTVPKLYVSSSDTITSAIDELRKSSHLFRIETMPMLYESTIDAKEIPRRKKRQISSSSIYSTPDELSKSSDVFRTETVPKIYESRIDAKEVPRRKKRHIVSSFSTIYSTLGKLSKSSDVFRTETVPKIYKRRIDASEIPKRKKKQTVSRSNTISSTFGKLSKSSDIFRTETVPKIYASSMNNEKIPRKKQRHIVSISSPTFLTRDKLRKSSDVFPTETVPKIYKRRIDASEIPKRKKKYTVSRSNTISSTFGKLSKSSDTFRTETVPKIYKSRINAKEIQKRKKKLTVSSSTFPSTFSKLSKSSDLFRTETVLKLYENNMVVKKIPRRKEKHIVSSFRTIPSPLHELSKSSDNIFHANSVSIMKVNDVDTEAIPNMNKENIISVSSTFPELSKFTDVFHTETVYNKDIPRKTKISISPSIPTTLNKLTSRQNSSLTSSTTLPTFLERISNSSDMFHSEFEPKQERKIDSKGINSKQDRHAVSISSSFLVSSSTLSKLSKSSDVVRTENLENIVKNDMDAKEIKNRKKRRNPSGFSSLLTTTGKSTSDVFNRETMSKIHKTILIDRLLSTFIGIN